MCESCQNYSNVLCLQFFAVWNFVWGILFLCSGTFTLYEMHVDNKQQELFLYIFLYATCVTAVLYSLSGVLILIGDWKDSAFLFKCGLILSNPFPIVSILTIYIPIVHIIALIRLCKFAQVRWK